MTDGITYRLSGRLGNHLQLWACARTLSLRHGLRFVYKPILSEQQLNLKTAYGSGKSAARWQAISKVLRRTVRLESPADYDSFDPDHGGDLTNRRQNNGQLFVLGWGSIFKRIDEYRTVLIQELLGDHSARVPVCPNSEDIGVHVRRDDGQFVLPLNFYEAAILKAERSLGRLGRIHLFSDGDVSLIRDSLSGLLPGREWILHRGSPLDDLLGLAAFQTLVISNSWFSYWSAFLSHDAKIYAPDDFLCYPHWLPVPVTGAPIESKSPSPAAAVVISTRNRRQDLARALRSALDQTAKPEVLVIDDGSTDGTTDMVRTSFPEARLITFETAKGYIFRRNQASDWTNASYVFSLDDDAEFVSPRTVEQTLADFSDPAIGAVAIPFTEHGLEGEQQRSPNRQEIWLASTFIGTAHAIRREVFHRVGKYRAELFHQGEESEFCLRGIERGYFVRLGNADGVTHHKSPTRNVRIVDFYGRRNEVLFCWFDVPMPYFPIRLAEAIFRGLFHGIKQRRPAVMVAGLCQGLIDMLRFRTWRRPVSPEVYEVFRTLTKNQATPLLEVIPNRGGTPAAASGGVKRS